MMPVGHQIAVHALVEFIATVEADPRAQCGDLRDGVGGQFALIDVVHRHFGMSRDEVGRPKRRLEHLPVGGLDQVAKAHLVAADVVNHGGVTAHRHQRGHRVTVCQHETRIGVHR